MSEKPTAKEFVRMFLLSDKCPIDTWPQLCKRHEKCGQCFPFFKHECPHSNNAEILMTLDTALKDLKEFIGNLFSDFPEYLPEAFWHLLRFFAACKEIQKLVK